VGIPQTNSRMVGGRCETRTMQAEEPGDREVLGSSPGVLPGVFDLTIPPLACHCTVQARFAAQLRPSLLSGA
jgi:hypothetical protein